MNHFEYLNGELCAEAVPLSAIAEAVETPFYCYSTATLTRHYQVFDVAFDGLDTLICYSVKANGNQAVIATLAAAGAGADIVSEGELRRALAAEIPADRIVFSGVGKTAAEIGFALDAGVKMFNVESLPELETVSAVAAARGARAPVALRINPDVDARTHDKIATGRKGDKFGIPHDQAAAAYALARSLPGVDIVGIDVHIGSQITDLEPFADAYRRLAGLVETLRAEGHDIRVIDIGGGLGIPYSGEAPPHPEGYARLIGDTLGPLGCQIVLEPGRLLVGNAGILVARVIYVKAMGERQFAIIDAGMNDLMRPALYAAWHDIDPVREPGPGSARAPIDVVGPVCESGDTFAVQRDLPPLAAGDLVAIRSAGAYGAVMSNSYNGRLMTPEVLVRDDRFAVVRPRPDYDDLIGRDCLPDWLASP